MVRFTFALLIAVLLCSIGQVSSLLTVAPEQGSRMSKPPLRGVSVGTSNDDAELQERATVTSAFMMALHRLSHPIGHWTGMVFGILTLFFSAVVHWYNERRSAKNQALVARGLAECKTVSAATPDAADRGSIVHVQGRVKSDAQVQDPQFAEVCLPSCIKLQSTVEVFEWVQTVRSSQRQPSGQQREKVSLKEEWVMKHCDSSNFIKPAPENPHLPPDLSLGTFTTTSERVLVGQFLLPDEMVRKFRHFKPCGEHLPQQLTAAGLTFTARSDGYYYARPSQKGNRGAPRGADAEMPQIGDIRAKFIFIEDNIDATVVALQTELEGEESFTPYRAVPRCCQSRDTWKQQMIEEGERPLKEQGSETMCEGGRLSSFCCCPCNLVASCTSQEILTEEIFFLADSCENREAPFLSARQRTMFRAFFFRLLGCGTSFLAMLLLLSWWIAVFDLDLSKHDLGRAFAAALLSANVWFTVAAAAWASYNPYIAGGWAVMDAILIAGIAVTSSHHSG